MEMPDFYIDFFLGYKSTTDLIENLYLQSLTNAYPKVVKTEGISELDENHIRDLFQKTISFESGKLSELINNNLVFLAVENQIINKDNERKRTDIEFNIPKLKFVIECKKIKGINKSQYINKGISRFINHEYIGVNEKYAGMCSFVLGHNIENIIKGTKERVEGFHWKSTANNRLCDFDLSFTTIHSKIDKNELTIYHLFFEIDKK